MAVKASGQISLSVVVDVKGTYRYYLLQSSTLSAPSVPTGYPPPDTWTDAEPRYTGDSTNSLYTVDCTLFCDDTFAYSAVSLSSSYEAAKMAYNMADIAQNAIATETSQRVERDNELETRITENYEYISYQFGAFEENIDTQITATARGVIAEYDYDASIEALQAQAAGFEAYQIHTEGYIKQGFIDYDESGVPILGVAIGQNLTSTTVTVGGEAHEQLDRTQSCAFYTADRVSFRINGQEVAYVSNRKLYIGDVEITGSVMVGDWQLDTVNGFTIKWIGG